MKETLKAGYIIAIMVVISLMIYQLQGIYDNNNKLEQELIAKNGFYVGDKIRVFNKFDSHILATHCKSRTTCLYEIRNENGNDRLFVYKFEIERIGNDEKNRSKN